MLAAVEEAEAEVFGADEDCADDVAGTGNGRILVSVRYAGGTGVRHLHEHHQEPVVHVWVVIRIKDGQ